jgi:hypothetical protein
VFFSHGPITLERAGRHPAHHTVPAAEGIELLPTFCDGDDAVCGERRFLDQSKLNGFAQIKALQILERLLFVTSAQRMLAEIMLSASAIGVKDAVTLKESPTKMLADDAGLLGMTRHISLYPWILGVLICQAGIGPDSRRGLGDASDAATLP